MKKTFALVLTLALVLTALFTLVGCAHQHVDKDGNYECDECGAPMEEKIEVSAELQGTYDLTLWVSELVKKDGDGEDAKIIDSVVEMTKRQIDAFEEANPGITINVTVEGVTEADAGSKVVADVASAPDIYCFAQDQLARLVQAGALAAPGNKAQAYISAINDAGAVGAATVGGKLYAYPMTSDNGYYLYYDKSVVTNPDSLEQIIADCEKAGKKFRYALENAWYTASFFFATECKNEWTTDEKGKFTSVDDTFNSEAGMVAMKGMQKLAQSTAYDSNADIFEDCAAIVTGVWNSQTAKTHFGEHLAPTDLPSFTVDGKSYHLGSYSGNKLMGVKPQEDPKKGAICQLLAQWLTSDKCQMERFNVFGWGPSSRVSQQNEAVLADPSLSALVAQNAYAIPQPQIHGSWWDIAKVLGAEAKAAKSDADLQAALDNYDAAIEALFNMTDDEILAWAVIGNVNGTSWDTDIAITPNADKTVWTAEITVAEGSTGFKLRRGGSWAPQVGDLNGSAYLKLNDSYSEPGNFFRDPGTYTVTLTLDAAGDAVTAVTVTFTPAN